VPYDFVLRRPDDTGDRRLEIGWAHVGTVYQVSGGWIGRDRVAWRDTRATSLKECRAKLEVLVDESLRAYVAAQAAKKALEGR